MRGEIFRTRPDRPWGLPSLLYSRYRVSFLGIKLPGRGINAPQSNAEVKERVELYTTLGLRGLLQSKLIFLSNSKEGMIWAGHVARTGRIEKHTV